MNYKELLKFLGEGARERVLQEVVQKEVDELRGELDNLEKRPFGELFGKRERFIVRYQNEKFAQAFSIIGGDMEKIDLIRGTYNGKKYGGELDRLMEETISDDSRYLVFLNLFNSIFGERDIDDEGMKKKMKKYLMHFLQQRNVYGYLLFSRNPLDVLRMSDVNDISSCHSPAGSAWVCAKNESRNLGGIVWIITESDYRSIRNDLDKEDILEDKDRGIRGIAPIARVRLRRFYDKATEEDFAVPEMNYYEPRGNMMGVSGKFTNIVLKYCQRHQSIFSRREEIDSDYIKKNIVHVGGNYTDNLYNVLLGKFLEKKIENVIPSKRILPISHLDKERIFNELKNSRNPLKVLGRMTEEQMVLLWIMDQKQEEMDEDIQKIFYSILLKRMGKSSSLRQMIFENEDVRLKDMDFSRWGNASYFFRVFRMYRDNFPSEFYELIYKETADNALEKNGTFMEVVASFCNQIGREHFDQDTLLFLWGNFHFMFKEKFLARLNRQAIFSIYRMLVYQNDLVIANRDLFLAATRMKLWNSIFSLVKDSLTIPVNEYIYRLYDMQDLFSEEQLFAAVSPLFSAFFFPKIRSIFNRGQAESFNMVQQITLSMKRKGVLNKYISPEVLIDYIVNRVQDAVGGDRREYYFSTMITDTAQFLIPKLVELGIFEKEDLVKLESRLIPLIIYLPDEKIEKMETMFLDNLQKKIGMVYDFSILRKELQSGDFD